MGLPLSHIHTAYIGEDSSILGTGTWNVWEQKSGSSWTLHNPWVIRFWKLTKHESFWGKIFGNFPSTLWFWRFWGSLALHLVGKYIIHWRPLSFPPISQGSHTQPEGSLLNPRGIQLSKKVSTNSPAVRRGGFFPGVFTWRIIPVDVSG